MYLICNYFKLHQRRAILICILMLICMKYVILNIYIYIYIYIDISPKLIISSQWLLLFDTIWYLAIVSFLSLRKVFHSLNNSSQILDSATSSTNFNAFIVVLLLHKQCPHYTNCTIHYNNNLHAASLLIYKFVNIGFHILQSPTQIQSTSISFTKYGHNIKLLLTRFFIILSI